MSPIFILTLVSLVPFLFIPLVVGSTLFFSASATPQLQLTGCLTIKPVLVVPVYFGIIDWLYLNVTRRYHDPRMLFAVLPNMVVTVTLVWLYYPRITKKYRSFVIIMLLLDAVQLTNQAYAAAIGWLDASTANDFVFFLPSILAVIALGIRYLIRRQEDAE